MKYLLGLVLLMVALVGAIPFIPLATAIDILQLRRAGLDTAQIEGNLLEGRLYEARLGSVPLGDVNSRMNLAELARGRLRIDVEGNDPVSRLRGGFSHGLGGAGLDDFEFGTSMMAGPEPIGNVTLILDQLDARFPGGRCEGASGRVRAYLSGAAPILGLPGEMSGEALCRDGRLAFELASASGREREELTILSPRGYRIRLLVKPASPMIDAQLRARGFVATADGLAYEEERTR